MKKVGILLKSKNYLLPYVSRLLEKQISLGYKVTGIHVDDETWAKDNLGCQRFVDFNTIIEECDLVFSLSYWKKISEEDIKKVSHGIINFHHSYELKYKGRHASTWVLKNNEKKHGSTMHYIDKRLDHGKIIDTDFFEVSDDDVAEDLFRKANDIGLSLLEKNLSAIIRGDEIIFKQHSNVSFIYKESDMDHEVKFQNKEELLRHVRALTSHNCPSPFIVINGKKIFLKLEGYDSGVLE